MVAKLIHNRSELLAIIDSHDDVWFAQRSKEGDRTRKGMLMHLAEAEHLYIWLWAKRARDEDNPNLGPGTRGTISSAPLFDNALPLSLAELRQRLVEQRTKSLEFMSETSDEEMERPIHGTPFGTLTVKQCIKSQYRHDRMHIEEMLGQPQTYDIRTQDGTRL